MTENTPGSPAGGFGEHPPTNEVPAYQPPAGYVPDPPAWAVPVPPKRRRKTAMVGVSVGAAIALVVGVTAAVVTLTSSSDARAEAPASSAPASSVDLRKGAVFMQANSRVSNQVAAFARGKDGKLTLVGRYPTGGTGSGFVEDTSGSVLLGGVEGESSPIQVTDKHDMLFVTNAGNNTISIFKVRADKLELVSQTSSGGEKPTSVSVSHGVLYVLNSGEFSDDFLTSPTTAVENCTTGQLPSVTGFKVTKDGELTPIPGSTRLLSGVGNSGCAQVGFSRDGKMLVVTERIAAKKDKATGFDKGSIITWSVRNDGTLTNQQQVEPAGAGPYGFTFLRDGTLITVEQNGAAGNEGGGQVVGYNVNQDGTLAAIGKPQATYGTDSCWLTVSADEKLAFVSSPFGGGVITSFSIEKDRSLKLLHKVASSPSGQDLSDDGTTDGVFDLAVTQDGKYLYAINDLSGELYGFSISPNGTLDLIDKQQVFDLLTLAEGGAGGPQGISVF